jgi:sugar phosphate isomerase/epimerase
VENPWLYDHVGYHVVYDDSVSEAINYASRNGFSSVQLDLNLPKFFPENYSHEKRDAIREETGSKNVAITVHAPELGLQSFHPQILKAVVARMEKVIDFAREICARSVTIHPGLVQSFSLAGEAPTRITDMYPELHRRLFGEALVELANYSKGSLFFCIENKEFTKGVMAILHEVIYMSPLYLTWDLAKMYHHDGSLMDEVESFFLKHLDKVRECHLHDVNNRGQHQIIGTGCVDFKKYLSILSGGEVNYTIEVRPREMALKSLENLRRFL